MFVILPLIALSLWIVGFRRQGRGWRESVLLSSIPWSLFVAYSTEFLSTFHQLTLPGLSVAWLIYAILTAGWVLLYVPIGVSRNSAATTPDGKAPGDPPGGAALDAFDGAALAAVGGLAAIAALTALVSAPNTWDAMEYHLPRVVQWMGNRGVQFYPTIDRQQLSMPPMSEYIMLHLYLLYGSDRLVNLVQWFAYFGCILGVSLITKELGGHRRAQAFAAVLGATFPAALLAASGAKNDNVLAYFIVLTVYLMLVWKRKQSWWLALAIGASISLAVFTKGTAYVLLPSLMLACWIGYYGKARWRFAGSVALFGLLLVSVCGPLWLRNYNMSRSVFGLPYFDGAGSIEGRKFLNSHLSPAQSLAGLIRNVAINLNVPSSTVNASITRICSNLIRAIGFDPNDFGQVFRSQSGLAWPFAVHWNFRDQRDEVQVTNQLNFLLFLAACALYLANYRKMDKQLGWLALGLIGSFVMFSAVIRWGPWNGRYQAPIFTLTVVFVALVMARLLPRWAIRSIMSSVLVVAVPHATMNVMRPWFAKHGLEQTLLKLPRDHTYFLDGHLYLTDSFIEAAKTPQVKNCRSVGLDVTLLRFEYPMMALIQKDDPNHRFQYLSVNNPTVAYADPALPSPCVVVCLGCARSAEKITKYGANHNVQLFEDVAVFSNQGSPVVYGEAANPGSQ